MKYPGAPSTPVRREVRKVTKLKGKDSVLIRLPLKWYEEMGKPEKVLLTFDGMKITIEPADTERK